MKGVVVNRIITVSVDCRWKVVINTLVAEIGELMAVGNARIFLVIKWLSTHSGLS